jgi:hypothetical protein
MGILDTAAFRGPVITHDVRLRAGSLPIESYRYSRATRDGRPLSAGAALRSRFSSRS